MSTYKDSSQPTEKRIVDLLAVMTISEKIRQTTVYPWIQVDWRPEVGPWLSEDGTFNPERIAGLLGDIAPGVLRGFESHRNAHELTNKMQQWIRDHTRLGIPALVMADSSHGHRGEWNVTYPEPIGLGATFDIGLMEAIGKAVARAARADGMNCLRTPICDLARDPRWGRCGECFGEDTWLVSSLAMAMVRGMGGEHLDHPESAAAELRHFIHAAPELGSNQTAGPIGERALRRLYLPPFRAAIRAGAQVIMAAYNTLDDMPCHADRKLLIDILREEIGFSGFVQSDATGIVLNMRYGLASSIREAAKISIEAGVDMQNYDFTNPEWEIAVFEALDHGELPLDSLDRAVANILRVKFNLGLFENPFAPNIPPLQLESRLEEDSALALRAARESLVLVKNDGLLPLRGDIGRIAVVGPAAAPALFGSYCDPAIRGAWDTEDPGGEGLLAGLRRVLPKTDIRWAPGCSFDIPREVRAVNAVTQFDALLRGSQGSDSGDAGIQYAVEEARKADMVIVAVGDQLWLTTSEGKDNAAAILPGRQAELVAAIAAVGKPMVLVVFADRQLVITNEYHASNATLMAWQPGWRGGTAVAEALVGLFSPSGCLPVTLPAHPCVLPVSHDSASLHHTYLDLKEKILLPFGFGLSYTKFTYRDLQISKDIITIGEGVDVNVVVKNSGDIAGDHVILCWVRQPKASVALFGKMLRGASRVHLPPGGQAQVTFHLGSEELAIVGADGRERVETGTRIVEVGELRSTFVVVE